MSRAGAGLKPDPRDFLRNPQRFVDEHVEWISPALELWVRFSWELRIGLKSLDEFKYDGKQFQTYKAYSDYKVQFSSLYDGLEKKTGSKLKAVLGMEIDNWKDPTAVPDNDYSRLVQQYFEAVAELNRITSSAGVAAGFAGSLHYQMYGATYELGAKRLVRAAEILSGKGIGDVGSALKFLRDNGHAGLVASFDNKLRNGVAHNNYIVNASIPPTIDYANVWLDKKVGKKLISRFSTNLPALQKQTLDVMWCVMAGMYVHAERYLDVVKSAIAAVS